MVRCAYRVIKEIKTIEQKNIFFKRNGGLLLKQQLSSGEVNIQKIKLFTSGELEKSTDNFSINRVVGHGGHGTVYKGMLADGRIVAVKKSKMVDEGQLSEFINEVVILSQIKHRNVVRLLEKSDVYSFGVVLVELLSGQKPVSAASMVNKEEEYRSLAAYFIVVMQEGRLFDIIDAQVLNEASTREIMTVAKLAKRFLNLNGKRRPTMKEVTTVLEAVQISMKDSNNIIT
ncbi:hypothetical protein ACLB2K_067225 [Fragaria x ananassa]